MSDHSNAPTPKKASAETICLDYYNEPQRAPLCVTKAPKLEDYDTYIAAQKAAQKPHSLYEQISGIAKSFFGNLGGTHAESPTSAPVTPKHTAPKLDTYRER